MTTGGDAYCWGANRYGALGVLTAPHMCHFPQLPQFDPFDCALAPIAVSGGLGFSMVTTGRGFTCGYTIAGDVYCWGLNEAGQLGSGTTSDSRFPVRVATTSDGT